MVAIAQRVRISTRNPGGPFAVRGQNVTVELVDADDKTTPIPGVEAVHWWVDKRSGMCSALLLVRSVEINAEASAVESFEVSVEDMRRLTSALQEERMRRICLQETEAHQARRIELLERELKAKDP